jgi:dephospho-CoA kinase
MKLLIGLTGHKTSGKDTVAEMLKPHFPSMHFVRVGFADALKEELARMTGGNVGTINKHKHEPLCRKVLQFIGQEAKALTSNDLIWVNKVKEYYHKCKNNSFVIIPDVRYLFEADWIKSEGGLVIRVFRPQADNSTDTHSSETELVKMAFDFSINNDGSLADLKRNTQWLAGHIKETYKFNI